MTCPHLINLLASKFETDEIFNILDIGGEKIDFYLNLKKNFKNVKYFLYNQESITETFHKIKLEFNYQDFYVIDKLGEILNTNYDFINLGSCIQYFDNYEEVLKRLLKIQNTSFLVEHIYMILMISYLKKIQLLNKLMLCHRLIFYIFLIERISLKFFF